MTHKESIRAVSVWERDQTRLFFRASPKPKNERQRQAWVADIEI